MPHRIAARVKLVDNGLRQRGLRILIASPIETGIDDPTFRHERGIIPGVKGKIAPRVPDDIATMKIGPHERSVERARIRIDKKLVRIEPVPGPRIIRTMHAIAIKLPRSYIRKVAVPNVARVFRQRNPMRLALPFVVKKTELHFFSVRGKDREIDTQAIEMCAKRRRLPPGREIRHDSTLSGRNTTTPNGGKVSEIENAWPCAATSSVT